MNEIEFEESPWEQFLSKLMPGDTVSGEQLLTLLEEEEEEFALQELEDRGILLDLSGLPRNYGSGENAVRLRREEQLVKKADYRSDLEASDPLRLYLEEVGQLPIAENLQTLAEKARSGDEMAMSQLTNGRLFRVTELAREFVGHGVLLLDLIQEGSLGLWKAVQAYPGGDFAEYSDARIRFSMACAVLMQAISNGLGQKLRRAMEDYRAVDERLLCDLGRNPTVEEIGEELHISGEEAARIEKMIADARRLEQAKPAAEEPEDDPDEQQSVENTALFQSRQRIAELLSDLSEQDRKLLSLRFGLEGGLPLSPEETGKRLGLTPEEVVTREAGALSRLRNSQL